jgi:glycosyltransferase involved in cell wall biosynthesis
MQVALIHNQFSEGGGMEAYMLALIRGFLSAGDDVHVHTYKVDHKFAASINCRVHLVNLSYLPRRWKKYAFLSKCNESFSRKDYDLSITMTRTFAADIAIIGGVHPASIDADQRKRHLLKRFHDAKEMSFEKDMLENVPIIVPHSKAIADDILKYYPQVEFRKLTVVYPPVDTEFFGKIAPGRIQDVRKKYQISTHKMTLLFVSTGHKRKGLPELLESFRQLDDKRFELLVAGESLRKFTDIPENVRYIGYVNNLSEVYSAVNYTILPSHYEPFGLAVVESLECGTPVIVTKNVGASELLTSAEAVILDNNMPATLAHAIMNLDKKQIKPEFVRRQGLSLANHVQCLKELVVR